MSEKNLTAEIKNKIKAKEISMKPSWYFVLGSILLAFSVASFLLMTLFFTSVNFYRLRAYGFSFFPLEFITINLVCLLTAFYLFKKYDFSYKKNITYLFISFLLLLLLAAFIFDSLGFNQRLIKRKVMQQIYYHQLPQPAPSPKALFLERRAIHRLMK